MITAICVFWFVVGIGSLRDYPESPKDGITNGLALTLAIGSSLILVAVYWPRGCVS